MTTGCSCGTPGCRGIAHEPGGRCPRCQFAEMPPGAARAVRQIIHDVLTGPEISIDDMLGGRQARQAEAGPEAGP